MKKLFCCLAALLLLLSSALAEGSLITGEITEGSLAGSSVYLLTDDTRLSGTVGEISLLARLEDGTLTLGTTEKAVRVRLPQMDALEDILARLQQQPTYENAVYSSLFIQAQQLELSAGEVAAIARELLHALPMLDPDGSLSAALNGADSKEAWATVTRYEADQRQYPNTWMLLVHVFSPALPALYAEIRTDEYGAKFTLAMSDQTVTDWDETIAAISDAAPGDTSRGRLFKGFTMTDNNGAQRSLYVECSCFGFALPLRLGVDAFIDAVDPRQWTAAIDLINDDTREALLSGSLESTVTPQAPDAAESAEIIDMTDGVNNAEWVSVLPELQ